MKKVRKKLFKKQKQKRDAFAKDFKLSDLQNPEIIRFDDKFYRVVYDYTNSFPVVKSLRQVSIKHFKRKYDLEIDELYELIPNIYDLIYDYEPPSTDFQRITERNGKLYMRAVPNLVFNKIPKFDWEAYHKKSTYLRIIAHISNLDPFIANWLVAWIYLLLFDKSARLPVLVLFSKERKTGKTTFVELLLAPLLEAWYMKISEADLNSRFTATYANKRLVYIEEASFEKASVKETLKSLTTSEYVKFELKGKDAQLIKRMLTFIITTNVPNFLTTSDEQDRFAILEVPTFEQTGLFVENLKEKLNKERNDFLNYLISIKDEIYNFIKDLNKNYPKSRFSLPAQAISHKFYAKYFYENLTQLQQAIIDAFLDIITEEEVIEPAFFEKNGRKYVKIEALYDKITTYINRVSKTKVTQAVSKPPFNWTKKRVRYDNKLIYCYELNLQTLAKYINFKEYLTDYNSILLSEYVYNNVKRNFSIN